jgi:putative Ca2+/H+ antiporter (TMEM165/GDT1 family)
MVHLYGESILSHFENPSTNSPTGQCSLYDFGMQQFFIVFASVFVAEVGDKTQLATMLFSTDQDVGKLQVFLAASAALIASTLLAVLAGDLVTRFVPAAALKIVAGIGFILVGIWTLISAVS